MDNGKCLCDMFYEGDLCGRFVGCKENGNSICTQILSAANLDESLLSNDYSSAMNELKETQKIMEGTRKKQIKLEMFSGATTRRPTSKRVRMGQLM